MPRSSPISRGALRCRSSSVSSRAAGSIVSAAEPSSSCRSASSAVTAWTSATTSTSGPGRACRHSVPREGPVLFIGDGTSIAGAAVISATRSVRLGQRVLLARNVYIADHQHAFGDCRPRRSRPGRRARGPGLDRRRCVAGPERRRRAGRLDRAGRSRSARTRSCSTTCPSGRSRWAHRRGSSASLDPS